MRVPIYEERVEIIVTAVKQALSKYSVRDYFDTEVLELPNTHQELKTAVEEALEEIRTKEWGPRKDPNAQDICAGV